MNTIESTVSEWPGIEVEQHRFGGRGFTLGGREIGHIHGSRLVDIQFAKPVRDLLIEEERAQKHHVYPDSGWVSYRIHSDDDVEGALWLLRVSYLSHLIALRKRERDYPKLEAVDIDAALAELDLIGELHDEFSDLRAAE